MVLYASGPRLPMLLDLLLCVVLREMCLELLSQQLCLQLPKEGREDVELQVLTEAMGCSYAALPQVFSALLSSHQRLYVVLLYYI